MCDQVQNRIKIMTKGLCYVYLHHFTYVRCMESHTHLILRQLSRTHIHLAIARTLTGMRHSLEQLIQFNTMNLPASVQDLTTHAGGACMQSATRSVWKPGPLCTSSRVTIPPDVFPILFDLTTQTGILHATHVVVLDRCEACLCVSVYE